MHFNTTEISSELGLWRGKFCGGFEDGSGPDSTTRASAAGGRCLLPRGAAPSIEFLLVNTNGGGKWTFPKGDPESDLSHGQAAEREAREEAGVRGRIESRHFCLYIHSKGVFWKPPGVREYVIKAFLLEVERVEEPARGEPESHLVRR